MPYQGQEILSAHVSLGRLTETMYVESCLFLS